MTAARHCAKRYVAAHIQANTALGKHRLVAGLLTLTICMGVSSARVCRAAEPGEATSDRAAQTEALRKIPWQRLSAPERSTVQYITKNASIYRRLPIRVIDCDPELFTFLVQHPEVVVDVWRVMGISRVMLADFRRSFSGHRRCRHHRKRALPV